MLISSQWKLKVMESFMLKTNQKLLCGTFVVMSLSGCASLLTDSKEIAEEGESHIRSAESEKSDTHVSRLIYSNDFYVPELSPEEEDKPGWWIEDVGTVGIVDSPIRHIMKTYLAPYGVNVRYLDGISETFSVSDVVHRGTLGELIEKIKFKSGLTYDVDGDLLTWKRFESELITVNAKPYSSGFKFGNDASESGGSSNSQGGNSSTSIQQFDSGFDTGSREVNYQSDDSDVWTEIETTLKSMGSADEEAKIALNRSSASVFLHDYPSKLEQMKEYLELINDRQNAQVAIDIVVVSFSRTQSIRRGATWDVFKQDLAAGGVFSFAAGSALNTENVPAMLGYTQESGKYAGSSIFLNVLDKNGIDYKVNSKSLLLANNYPGTSVIGGDVVFAVGSDSQATANVGTTSSLRAGSVRSGNSFYMVPTVVEDNISLLLSSSMTSLKQLREVTAGDAKIEAPEVNVDELGTMFNVADGNTAVFSDKTTSKNTDENSTAGFCILFCDTSQSESVTERIVLITPKIVRGG